MQFHNSLVLNFTEIGSGLISKENKTLKGFSIADSDGKFVWANALIKGDKVIVSSDKVVQPVKVRYAWSDNPEDANLYNKENLPASPFESNLKN